MDILLGCSSMSISQVLERRLVSSGYLVTTCISGPECVDAFHKKNYDLLLVDSEIDSKMGGVKNKKRECVDGTEVCREVRRWGEIPLIVFGQEGSLERKLELYEIGVDDYLLKPISPREVEARMKAVLLRSHRHGFGTEVLKFGDFEIDFVKQEVFKGGENVRILELDFRVLEMLLLGAGYVYSTEEILSKRYGMGVGILSEEDGRVLAKMLFRLRKVFGSYLVNVRGEGYMFQELCGIYHGSCDIVSPR